MFLLRARHAKDTLRALRQTIQEVGDGVIGPNQASRWPPSERSHQMANRVERFEIVSTMGSRNVRAIAAGVASHQTPSAEGVEAMNTQQQSQQLGPVATDQGADGGAPPAEAANTAPMYQDSQQPQKPQYQAPVPRSGPSALPKATSAQDLQEQGVKRRHSVGMTRQKGMGPVARIPPMPKVPEIPEGAPDHEVEQMVKSSVADWMQDISLLPMRIVYLFMWYISTSLLRVIGRQPGNRPERKHQI